MRLFRKVYVAASAASLVTILCVSGVPHRHDDPLWYWGSSALAGLLSAGALIIIEDKTP